MTKTKKTEAKKNGPEIQAPGVLHYHRKTDEQRIQKQLNERSLRIDGKPLDKNKKKSKKANKDLSAEDAVNANVG